MNSGDEDDRRARRVRLARALLAYVLVPAWVVPSLADWAFHRRTHIERNAGAAESLTHVAMALEAGAGIVAGTVLELDAGTVCVMALAALVHEATAVFDVAYARPRRLVAQAEQHVHSFLEVLPFVNALLGAFAHGARAPRFALRVRRDVPAAMLLVCGASSVLGIAPYVEELIRCLRARR